MRALILGLLLVSSSDYLRSGYQNGGDDLYRALCAKDGVSIACEEAYDYQADVDYFCREADEACEQ